MKLLLVLLCLFIFASHVLYVSKTQQYPVWDEHHYVGLAIRYYDFFQQHGIAGIAEVFSFQTNRQPLYSLLITIFLLMFRTGTYKIALLLNGVLLCCSIVGIYLIGRKFFRELPSLMAAFLFATYGNVIFYSHFSYVETAVTTAIVWTLVALSQKRLLIAGVLTAVATLTRFIAPVFLLGPILLTLRLKRNTVLFLIPAILLPLFLYFLPSREAFLTYVTNNQTQGAEWVTTYRDPAMAQTHSVRSIMFYFNILSQNTIVMFGLFVIGVLIAIRYFRRYAWLLTAFIIPYAFLTFITIWKEDRFMVPIYPAMALLSAVVFQEIKNLRVLIILTIVTVSIGMLNFFGGAWGLGPMGQRGLVDYVTPRWVPHPRRIYLTPLVWPPQPELTNAHLVVDAIAADHQGKASLLLDVQNDMFRNALLAIISYERRDVVELIATGSAVYLATQKPTEGTLVTSFVIPADQRTVYLYKMFE